MEAAASSVPSLRKSYREILAEKCTFTEDGFVSCAIDLASKCKFRQPVEKFDSGNFIRHARTQHADLAKARGLIREDMEVPAKKRKVSKIMIAIDRQTLIEAMIKLVTFNHVPLSCVTWEGFQLLLKPIEDALNVCMNRENLKNHVKVAAGKIKSAIKEMVKGRLVSLKIDSASRHGRHILGINLQFFDQKQGEIVIVTLGMIELNERHTGKFLKLKIEEILKTYGLTLEQIFSITCDNGANMVKAVKELQTELQKQAMEAMQATFLDGDEGNAEDDAEDDTEDDTEDDDEEPTIEWMEAVEKEFMNSITLVRCAVHTMQLSVTDVMKSHEKDIRQCTTVAKNCRNKTVYRSIFNSGKQPLPPLYGKTRWGGVFMMLAHFEKHEAFYRDIGSQHPELDLSENWSFIKEYVAAFEPIYIATKQMQEKHTSLNGFYLAWIKVTMNVSKRKLNRFVEPLKTSLARRVQQLKDNMVFKAAMLMDPRFNYLNSTIFSMEEKEEVRKFIVATWERIKRIKPQDHVSPSTPQPDQDERSELEAFLTEMFGGLLPEQDLNTSTQLTSDRFLRQVKELDLEPHYPYEMDIWMYWMSRKFTHPELYEVATALFAVPSNQVSVERAFSALALVLSDKRTKLNEETLENLLLIKLNKELFNKIVPNMYNWLEENM